MHDTSPEEVSEYTKRTLEKSRKRIEEDELKAYWAEHMEGGYGRKLEEAKEKV